MTAETTIFLKGVLVGFVIAAPTGPIGILCSRRVLTHGRRAAFASGMGAATADVIYGFLAAFGLTYLSHMLAEHHLWLRIAGGTLLCAIGIRTFFLLPQNCGSVKTTGRQYAGLYTSMFFLTLTNPATILSLGAVFAGLGLAGERGNVISAGTLVLGVFLGSVLWWVVLIGIFTLFKSRIGQQEVLWVNRMAGIVIAGSGVLALFTLAF